MVCRIDDLPLWGEKFWILDQQHLSSRIAYK